jgi:hypothetical protein
MAKSRYIKDSFWTDPYIERMSPDYKLVFLYLLTNPLANISGVYEIRLKRMAFETGYDAEVIENILQQFVKDDKIIRIDHWIVIKNHIKHQSLGESTAAGINREIQSAPQIVQDLFQEQEITNSNKNTYMVLILKESTSLSSTAPIRGLQAPVSGILSRVELSKVNKIDNSIDNIYITYGEFKNVRLKQEDYQKLALKFGESSLVTLIEELSIGIASKGYKYKNHYATLLNWARRKEEKQSNRSKSFAIIA